VIIFVSQRTAAEELSENLVKFNFRSAALHGDKTQSERDSIFAKFKKVCLPLCASSFVESSSKSLVGALCVQFVEFPGR